MQDEPVETRRRAVTRQVRVRRPLGRAFWLTSVVVVLGLTAVVALTQVDTVEDDLGAAVQQELADNGLRKVRVEVDGVSVAAQVPLGTDAERVEAVVAAVPGVGGVAVESAYANDRQARACASLARDLERATGRQRIPFEGETSRLTPQGEAMLARVADVLRACPAGDVVVGGHADEDTPDGSTLSLERARVMVAVLVDAGVAKSRLQARGYGDQFPVDESGTDAARRANQRGSVEAGGA